MKRSTAVLLPTLLLSGCNVRPESVESERPNTPAAVREPGVPMDLVERELKSPPKKPADAKSPRTDPNSGFGPREPIAPPPMPPKPVEPKPSETVKLKYEAKGNSVEVVGVCRISEDAVSCWSPDGTKDAGLENRVRGVLQQHRGMPCSFKIGLKNRQIVLRIGFPTHSQPGDPTLAVQYAGSEPNRNDGIFLPLHETNPTWNPSSAMRYSWAALSCAEDPSAKTTKARLELTEALEGAETMPCQTGAKHSARGVAIQIDRIGRADPSGNTMAPGTQNPQQWSIEARFKASAKNLAAALSPLDDQGDPIHWVDPKGVPVSEQKHRELMRSGARAPDGTRTNFVVASAAFYQQGGGRSVPIYVTNVDPKYIKSLRITYSKSKRVDIVGIPLDPKKIGTQHK